ncbi:MAG TPA: single-stranded-DNA-specific exonuclease RecJ [Puia sp.]|nr:single-stranded-DNA-specific exonuclease RecJ [Puia sp.]
MQKRWNILHVDNKKSLALQEGLKISPALCRVLAGRGVETYEQARQYFRPRLDELHDPWLMKDMDKAADRVLSAISAREKILIFGDYDVDGTTAVACMFMFLKKNYAEERLDFYIPNRYREGYGISKAGIDFAIENHFSLIIALDCGIKSNDLIGYAAAAGIDFIVCDHHLPDPVLPPAVAILNPKQIGCNYPYRELSGCGIGFKLMTALSLRIGRDPADLTNYLDLVATSIAADVVPMTGENRILAYFGLQKANNSPNAGIASLIELSGLKNSLTINNLVFMIAPRVNAAGRMDDARKAVQMFISSSFEEAKRYAEMLHSDNDDRKEADLQITEEALVMIESDKDLINKKTTVVFQPHWNKGVVGIVASRLIERYYRPTVVLTRSGEVLAGSARSVSGFNLYEAVHACRDHLLGYGGHFAAAGMTLLPEAISSFTEKFEQVVASTIAPELLIPEITIDAEIRLKDITPAFFNIICQMEPFGPENTRPLFIARQLTDSGYSKIVKQFHIRFSLQQDGIVFSGIGFHLSDKFELLQKKKPVDVVFTIDENEWNGQKHLQLKVADIRQSGLN